MRRSNRWCLFVVTFVNNESLTIRDMLYFIHSQSSITHLNCLLYKCTYSNSIQRYIIYISVLFSFMIDLCWHGRGWYPINCQSSDVYYNSIAQHKTAYAVTYTSYFVLNYTIMIWILIIYKKIRIVSWIQIIYSTSNMGIQEAPGRA